MQEIKNKRNNFFRRLRKLTVQTEKLIDKFIILCIETTYIIKLRNCTIFDVKPNNNI